MPLLDTLSKLSELLGYSISSFIDSNNNDNIVLELSGKIEIKRVSIVK